MRRFVELLLLLTGILAGSATAEERFAVKVRGGEHPTFGRIVFDWERAVDYSVVKDGNDVRVLFSAGADFDLKAVDGQSFGPVETIKPEKGAAGSSAVRITLPPGATHRHFRDGTKVAVDFFPPETQASGKTPAPQKSPSSGAPVDLRGGTKAITSLVPQAKREPDPQKDKKATAPVAPPAALPGSVRARAELIPGGGIRLRFPTPDGTGLAAFERAGKLWVVFNRPGAIDLAGLGGGAGGPVAEARQLPNADAAVVTLAMTSRLSGTVTRRDGEWLIDLTDPSVAVGATPLGIVSEPYHPTGPRVALPTSGVSRPVEIRDPDVGDRVFVVPLTRAGIGVPAAREYPQFRLLASVQGVAVSPKSDVIKVEAEAEGIAISAEGELQIAGAYPDGNVPAGTKAPTVQAMPFLEWAGPPGQFLQTKKTLLEQVALAGAATIGNKRLALARFYFANGDVAEGYGVLSRALKAEPALIDGPGVRLLRAAMLIELGRQNAAASDLDRPDLIGNVEAALWRSKVDIAKGDDEQAIRDLRRGEAALRRYPADRQASFRIMEAEAHLRQGDPANAKKALEQIDAAVVPKRFGGQKSFLTGQVETLLGNRAGARKAFEAAIASGYRPVEFRSRLAIIEDQLAQKEIDRPKAIQEMDRLRVGWRGDDFEPTLLRRIGALKMDNGDWREGFQAFKEAAALFAKTPQAKLFAEDMSRAFERLFLEGEAQKLPAVEALALYYDYRELTPTGAKGDEMIRNLADRLAAVDLLDQAALLIEHQARFRVSGEDKAKLVNRLAILRLLDRQPEKAIKALELTARQQLSPAMAAQRSLLLARAQGDLGQFDEARKTVAPLTGEEAEALRLELASKAKDWPEAARIAGQIAEAKVAGEAGIDEAGRRAIVRWATALALSGGEEGLQKLRGRFAKAFEGKPEAEAFLVLTSKVDRDQPAFLAAVKRVAGVEQLEAFMSSYRERLKTGPLSAIN